MTFLYLSKKKCVYCDFRDSTAVEIGSYSANDFLHKRLCEKCDTYHEICPTCRNGEMLCPNCNSFLIIGKTMIDRFDMALKNKNDNVALDILTEMGININSKTDAYGCGVVHMSVRAGRLNVLREVIKRGANYDLKEESGLTPLDFAYLPPGKKHSIRILEKLGASCIMNNTNKE
ncbi:hypothetical protein D3C80_1145040 [compost metagenome]